MARRRQPEGDASCSVPFVFARRGRPVAPECEHAQGGGSAQRAVQQREGHIDLTTFEGHTLGSPGTASAEVPFDVAPAAKLMVLSVLRAVGPVREGRDLPPPPPHPEPPHRRSPPWYDYPAHG